MTQATTPPSNANPSPAQAEEGRSRRDSRRAGATTLTIREVRTVPDRMPKLAHAAESER